MYIYNITINIDESVHETWLHWMKEVHIPNMLATGKFVHARMCLVMVLEDDGGFTYAVQYHTPSRETLQNYYRENAESLRLEAQQAFPEKFVAFRTELEVVDEQSLLQ